MWSWPWLPSPASWRSRVVCGAPCDPRRPERVVRHAPPEPLPALLRRRRRLQYRAPTCSLRVRVTLVTRHAELAFMPLALLYLKAALVDHVDMAADDVTILEFGSKTTADELAAAIDASAPDVLGLSCYVWNVIDLMAAAAAVKIRRPDLRVVAGGPEVGPIAERVMQAHPCVDVIVKSEGEGPIVELVNCWRTGNDLSDVLGIWERQAGRVVEHPDVTHVAELDELSSPHLRGYVPHHQRIVCVETQRGCVFRCSFCFYNKDFSIRNRRFDLDRVKDEIGFWLEQDIEQLYLMDPVFNLNKVRAKEICHFLIERNRQRIPIHAEVWAEFIDDELAALMKAANFTYLEVRLQSTNPTALAPLDRREIEGRAPASEGPAAPAASEASGRGRAER